MSRECSLDLRGEETLSQNQPKDGILSTGPGKQLRGLLASASPLLNNPKRQTLAKPPFTEAIDANDVWCMDFKGWFRTRDGMRIDPLTVQDAPGTSWHAVV